MPKNKESKGKSAANQGVGKELAAVQKIAMDVGKTAEAVKAIVRQPPQDKQIPKKEEQKGFFDSIVNWVKDSGLQTLISLAPSLLLDETPRGLWLKSKVKKSMVGTDTVIPAGTIIYSSPISPEMFGDENARAQKMMSLFTYYKFADSYIEYNPSQGDLVNGLIAILIVPDPDVQITTDDPAVITRLVREYSGTIEKLSKPFRVKIPSAPVPLHVQDGDEPRLSQQAVLYVIAFTDIDLANTLGEVNIRYNVLLRDKANTGVTSVPRIKVPFAAYSLVNNYVVTTTASNLFFQQQSSVGFPNAGVSAGNISLPAGYYTIQFALCVQNSFVTAGKAVLANLFIGFNDAVTDDNFKSYMLSSNPIYESVNGASDITWIATMISVLYDGPFYITIGCQSSGPLTNGPITIFADGYNAYASTIGVTQCLAYENVDVVDPGTLSTSRINGHAFFRDVKCAPTYAPHYLRHARPGVDKVLALKERRKSIQQASQSSGAEF